MKNVQTAVEKINKQNTVDPKESIVVQNNNNKKPDNNLPKPYFENINSNQSNKTEAVATYNLKITTASVSGNNDAVVKTKSDENINDSCCT